jgi:hypothetical protein
MDQTLAMHKRRWQPFPVGDPTDLFSVLGQVHCFGRIAFFGPCEEDGKPVMIVQKDSP